MTEIKELVKKSYKDDVKMEELINKFKPLIYKLSNQINYYCSETDLLIEFMELIRKINKDNMQFSNDGFLVSYINTSMNNRKLNLLKKNKKHMENEVCVDFLEEKEKTFDPNANFENNSLLHESLNTLNKKERELLIKLYMQGFNQKELAKTLDVSPQYISKVKKKALKKLKDYLQKNNF